MSSKVNIEKYLDKTSKKLLKTNDLAEEVALLNNINKAQKLMDNEIKMEISERTTNAKLVDDAERVHNETRKVNLEENRLALEEKKFEFEKKKYEQSKIVPWYVPFIDAIESLIKIGLEGAKLKINYDYNVKSYNAEYISNCKTPTTMSDAIRAYNKNSIGD